LFRRLTAAGPHRAMAHYYIYYRIDPASLPRVRQAIAELFETVERQTGVRGRWMHRRDDPATCMEVYEGVVDEARFEAVLTREAPTLGLARHVECFTDSLPDAAAQS
jgi:hypothetical protein